MDITTITGLSSAEVLKSQQAHGYNELPDREKKSLPKIILEVLTEPMIFLLLAVVLVYFVLGDKTEALVLLFSVVVIVAIELYQNNKTEKALEALRNLSSPSCTVIRDGTHQTVASRELVVGDMIVIAEGARVPADAHLVAAENVMADESLLTGESVPVDKSADASDKKLQTVYSGSMVVKGHGVAEVVAVGPATEIGKIGTSLNAIVPERTLLQKETDRVVKVIAVIAISAAVLITMVFWLSRGNLVQGFLAGLTLSIAMLPEEFPVVLTVFMALGAWRLAKSNVLARKSTTIETLGSATVLCTDKTGTLTENRMQIQAVTDENGHDVALTSDQYKTTIAYGVLASQIKPFDPMEEAFLLAAYSWTDDLQEIYRRQHIVKEYPLEPQSLSVVHVWADKAGEHKVVALKGAPEEVFRLCGLDDAQTKALNQQVTARARQGLRVLAVARGIPQPDLPADRQQYQYELLGLVALADPIRREAAEAIRLCRSAGIRVIMITGDYAETAQRIGREIGLDSDTVLTGEAFSQMTDKEQDEAVRTTSIFSRVIPAHKLLIVNALKDNGEVVAMTGDGVNDAPALKSAHIGIAMGQRGTDVAREAASIVLLDDNFASIVRGVRLGRRIFTNLQKAMMYILVVHMPIITLSLVPVLFGWPLVLLPIHIVFFEFIVDPSCTLIFESESEEPGAMKQPPRRLGQSLFNIPMLLRSLLTGGTVSLVILLTHWYMITNGWAENKARAVTFLLIILTNVLLILAISGLRSVREMLTLRRPTAMTIVVGIVVIALVVVYSVPAARELFKIDVLSTGEITAVCGLGIATVAAVMPFRRLFVS